MYRRWVSCIERTFTHPRCSGEMIFLRGDGVIRLYELHYRAGCRVIPAENRLKVFCLAEGVRFELTKGANPCQFSRLVHSTALPALRGRAFLTKARGVSRITLEK